MILYLTIIFIAVIINCCFNIIFPVASYGGYAIWIFAVMILAVIIEIGIDAVIATVIHALPNKWFDIGNRFYEVGKKERVFYDRLKIKTWKDKVLELGSLNGFSKSKVKDPNDPNYIKMFIIECNKGVLIHLVIMFAGFLILLFPTPKYFLRIGLTVAVVNLFLNLLPTMVLRYNTPKLKIAYQRAVKNNEREIKISRENKNESN